MTTTVALTPTPMYPTRRATLVLTDLSSGTIYGTLEVNESYAPPDGTLTSRFTVMEILRRGNPGDRFFCLKRPAFVTDDLVCLPADPREFSTCTCKKWRDTAWCLHVECLRALQSENLLRSKR